jgi:hypothetical protein
MLVHSTISFCLNYNVNNLNTTGFANDGFGGRGCCGVSTIVVKWALDCSCTAEGGAEGNEGLEKIVWA